MMNPGAETFTVVLQKGPSEPWGFRLQGGADFTTPLSIQSVNQGSIAERYGVRPGDAVLQINNKATEPMNHDDAKTEIMLAGNQIQFLLQRGAVSIWRPQVTPITDLKPNEVRTMPGTGEVLVQRTSLAANKQPGVNVNMFNKSARGWPGAGGGGFGGQAAPQQFNVQASGQQQTVQGSQSQYQPGYPGANQDQGYAAQNGSFQQQISARGGGAPGGGGAGVPGMRSVKAPVTGPPSQYMPAQHFTCNGCSQLVTGVFVKVAGEPYHPQCFKCARCGRNLKQQGYYEENNQLICDNCRPQQTAVYS